LLLAVGPCCADNKAVTASSSGSFSSERKEKILTCISEDMIPYQQLNGTTITTIEVLSAPAFKQPHSKEIYNID